MPRVLTAAVFAIMIETFSLGRLSAEPAIRDSSERVASPDGSIQVQFTLRSGKPFYSVSHHNKPLLLDSSLGIRFQDAPALDSNFALASLQHSQHDSVWDMVWGEYDKVRDHYHELTVDLEEQSSPGRKLQLIFRVFNDGVGFRYVLPEQSALRTFAITEEDSEFRFAGDFTAYWIPAQYGSGIGDEELYRRTPLSQVKAAQTPLTIESSDRGYVTIHEADLIDYASMTVAPSSKNSPSTPVLRSALVPMPDGIKVRGTTPHRSPWRALVIGDEATDLIESTMILNLNPPCAICDDSSWIKPGKYVGIWWEMHKGVSTWVEGPQHGATTANTKKYIDFAARHGIPYVLTEGWNKGWSNGKHDFLSPVPGFQLHDVVDYAKSRGVNWMAHNENRGDISNYDAQIDDAYALYEELGVPAVKTGYAANTSYKGISHPHYDQVMVNRYRDHIRKAAEHHLMIEAHEIIKDTGERRSYPNFMSREAVRGMEYEAWSSGNPPEHVVNIPFTRMIAGPVSYTPGIFNINWDPGRPGFQRVHSTRAMQLAMYPVFLSGLQMLADVPENYEGQPGFEFLKQVPTTWDDTKAINGKIGDFVTIARRSGSDWYVGSMTDENARSLLVPLEFLDPGRLYTATVYSDAHDTDWNKNPSAISITRLLVGSGDVLTAAMGAGGGQAIRLVPASGTDLQTLPQCAATAICRGPEDAHVSIQPLHSSKCLDVRGGSHVRGEVLQQYRCNLTDAQKFIFRDLGDGYSLIVNSKSGLCLDVSGWSKDPGERIIQWVCHGGDNQKFKRIPSGGAAGLLQNKHSGLCLDVGGWSIEDRAPIVQWNCHAGANQQWTYAVE